MRDSIFNHEVREGTRGALVGVVMGSQSDWPTMYKACELLDLLGIPWERRIISAHRTPQRMFDYAHTAEDRGLMVIIAGAGGAAHLPGMISGSTLIPVHGVPVQSKALNGLDSLLSIVQMPPGVPTATFSIGEPGAANAALQAARVLALRDPAVRERLQTFVNNQRDGVALVPIDQ